jgi:hypothetical protein
MHAHLFTFVEPEGDTSVTKSCGLQMDGAALSGWMKSKAPGDQNSESSFSCMMRKYEAAQQRKSIRAGANLVCREVEARSLDSMRALTVTASQAEVNRIRRCPACNVQHHTHLARYVL